MRETLRRLVGYFRIEHALFLVPIFGFAIYDSVFSAFSSILAVLGEAYPDVPRTTIQMILSVPPMVSIPGTLLSGFLASYVHKKRIAEFALAVIFVGGMIPVVFQTPSIAAMFACSACVGLGQGLLHPMANAFICQGWEDDGERSRALGFKQAFNFIGEALVALCVGFLALSHWGNAFLVYLGVVPVFLFAHFVLPKGELDKRLVDREHRAAGLKELFRPKTVYLFALFFCAMLFLYGFHTMVFDVAKHLLLAHGEHLQRLEEIIAKPMVEPLFDSHNLLQRLLGERTGEVAPYDGAAVAQHMVGQQVLQVAQDEEHPERQVRDKTKKADDKLTHVGFPLGDFYSLKASMILSANCSMWGRSLRCMRLMMVTVGSMRVMSFIFSMRPFMARAAQGAHDPFSSRAMRRF